MDHQGASRTRRAADTRRQPPWPSADSPGYPEGSAFPGGSQAQLRTLHGVVTAFAGPRERKAPGEMAEPVGGSPGEAAQ